MAFSRSAAQGLVPGRVGFLEIAARVEGEHPDGQVVFEDEMGDNLVFEAEGGGERNAAGKWSASRARVSGTEYSGR